MKSLCFCFIFFTIVGFQVCAASSDKTDLDLVTANTLYLLELLARIPIKELEKIEFTKSVLDQTELVVRGVSSKLQKLNELLDKADNNVLPSQLKEIKNVIFENLAYLNSADLKHKLKEVVNTDIPNQVFNQLPENFQSSLLIAGREVNILLMKLLKKYNEMRRE